MKIQVYTLQIIVVSIFGMCIFSCENVSKSNLYLLNETIPKDSALVFGECLISTDDFEFAITFNPTMDELFFTRRKPEQNNEIYTMKLEEGKWSAPKTVSFKANIGWDFEPHITPNGNRLYFGSLRPLEKDTASTGLHQWYCEKTDLGWSAPVALQKPFTDKDIVMYLTSSSTGNLYFTSGEKNDKPSEWCIYNAKSENGQYNSIERLGANINFEGINIAHPYIAPDESFMIYDAESDDGYGDSDLYISFQQNGQWTKAQNLGASVNTEQTEMCASVSPDGNYLFFHRSNDEEGDIYWISFKPIKEKFKSAIK